MGRRIRQSVTLPGFIRARVLEVEVRLNDGFRSLYINEGIRRLDAIRKLVDAFEAQLGCTLPEGVQDGRDPGEIDTDQALKDQLEWVLEVIANEWSNHEDYRENWDDMPAVQSG
jgi:hypothetical protein